MQKKLKRYGQNFLVDKNIIGKITGEIDPGKEDHIAEIGPGGGALTGAFFESAGDYTGIEIDARWAEKLEEKYPGITIVNSDVTDVRLGDIVKGNRLKIAGNIPYNITTPIIKKLMAEHAVISEAVLMVQREAALRLLSERGTKDYGVVPILLRIFTEPKYCFTIPAGCFSPKPNVDSALIHLLYRETDFNDEFYVHLNKLLVTLFAGRRKTLKNSLRNSIFENTDFSRLGIDLNKRPEELAPEEFVILTNFWLEKGYE